MKVKKKQGRETSSATQFRLSIIRGRVNRSEGRRGSRAKIEFMGFVGFLWTFRKKVRITVKSN